MKLLFLHTYFKPDVTSSAHFGENLREALAEQGHTMEVYTPTPTRGVSAEVRREYAKNRREETELNGAVRIHRFPLFREGKNSLGRALRYGILELQHLWFALRAKDVDVMPVGSTPPINGLMAILIKKWKKIPYVFTVQDMFPESLVNAGMTKKGSLLWKIGNWISNVTYREAEHIIVICHSMKDSLISKGVPEEKISVVYNWIDTDATHPVLREENPLFEELGLSRELFYVTYAGNLGNLQNVDLLVDCAEKLKDHKDIFFAIFGSGTEKERLQQRIDDSGLANIRLLPIQPVEKVSQVYSLADASFVTCKKGVGGSAFPSKAASIMATGTPVIASFDLDSDLCRLLKENNAGLCAEAEDADAATAAILELYNHRELAKEMGQNARKLACSHFSRRSGTAAKIAVFERFSRAKKQEETK